VDPGFGSSEAHGTAQHPVGLGSMRIWRNDAVQRLQRKHSCFLARVSFVCTFLPALREHQSCRTSTGTGCSVLVSVGVEWIWPNDVAYASKEASSSRL